MRHSISLLSPAARQPSAFTIGYNVRGRQLPCGFANHGPVIAFAGIDGSGKSSIINGLLRVPSLSSCVAYRKTYTNSVDSLLSLYASDLATPSRYLRGPLAVALRWAFALDFVCDYEANATRVFTAPRPILVDRWSPCATAWAATVGIGQEVQKVLHALPPPDLIIYLDVSVREAITRIGAGRKLRLDEHPMILRKFRDAYADTLGFYQCPTVMISASQPLREVLERVANTVDEFLRAHSQRL